MAPMTKYPIKATNDTLSHKLFLGEIMDVFDGDEVPDVVYTGVVGTCAGEWRKEAGQIWRFWKYED